MDLVESNSVLYDPEDDDDDVDVLEADDDVDDVDVKEAESSKLSVSSPREDRDQGGGRR